MARREKPGARGMTDQTYSEKLRDPRWQKKRLKVLERDEYTCQRCGADSKELHVHHGYYRRHAEPWEYESSTLHTLCRDCHSEIAQHHEKIKFLVGQMAPADLAAVASVLNLLVEIGHEPCVDVAQVCGAIDELLNQRIADARKDFEHYSSSTDGQGVFD